MVTISVTLAILFSLAGWFVANRVISPLQEITTAANALSRGEITVIPRHQSILEIEVLSNSLATLVDNLTKSERDREKFRHEAVKDHLTGLLNRTGLAAYLDAAIPRAAREKGTLEIFYMDLDGFKPVNDRYGHHTGDLVLVAVAKRLSAGLREHDALVRLGGDEFLLLLETWPNHSPRAKPQ